MRAKLQRVAQWCAAFAGVVVPVAANAALPALLPACTESGKCSSCDILVMFLNWAELIAYSISSFAILMFVIGGVLWITSGGNTERVQRGRTIMVEAVIGTLLVFAAYAIVGFTLAALIGTPAGGKVSLFGGSNEWSEICTEKDPLYATSCSDGAADGAQCQVSGGCNDGTACICYQGQCTARCEVPGQHTPGKTGTCQAQDATCAGETIGGLCSADTGESTCCIPTN